MIWTIRDAIPADFLDISLLEQSSFRDPWSRKMLEEDFANDWSHFRLLETRDPLGQQSHKIIGFCIYWHVVDELHLLQIVIEPTQQRQGLGRKLMEDLFHQGQKAKAIRVFLEVRQSNQAALGLYHSMNFQCIGTRKMYYADPTEDAIVMESLLPTQKLSLRL